MHRKTIILALNCLFILALSYSDGQAGLLGDPVPKGKEIKDPYLEQLFAPDFPYESIKVIETGEGKRYVVIKANEKVTGERRIDYEKNTLRKRGIVVYRSGSPRTDRLLISEMRLYRVVSRMPYVVEYSEVIGGTLEQKDEVESVVRDEGKYLIVLINKDFGKVFRRVEIYPEKETKCPEPPFVGKYPNARSISCAEKNKWYSFTYVTKDKGKIVYDYYKDKLKAHYKKVGFNFPERAWEFNDEFGIQIRSYEVARVGTYFNPQSKEASKTTVIPMNGMVPHIVIMEIGLMPTIEEYSLIRIYYTTDQEKINKNIDRMKKRYPKEITHED
jgi:hypothetical protein